jgi:hypothetical protein
MAKAVRQLVSRFLELLADRARRLVSKSPWAPNVDIPATI